MIRKRGDTVAQRVIHYLFGAIIAEQIQLKDKKRFLLGSILPDAAAACDRDKAHFKVRSDSHVYYDFDAFRNLYRDRMLWDDLYFGYYMHLVEDAFYRGFIYSGRFRMPRSPEEVKILHDDYRALNAHIVGRYGVTNLLGNGAGIEEVSVSGIASFSVRDFLNDMSRDFTAQRKGDTVFLTEEMVDEFVETYVPQAIDEAKRVQSGASVLNARDYAWPRKN